MAEETRKGAGGDVVAFSTEPFSPGLLEKAAAYPHILTSEMFTVALAPANERTLFSKLKAVQKGYPYYGTVTLESGRDIHQALAEGVVVEARVLERLEQKVGDRLKIGNANFLIADVALGEPDRPMGMWGVSPRIFIAWDQLSQTGLVRDDSYLERRIHLKLADPNQAGKVAEELRQVAVPDQERVETWERPPVNMERYVDNFFTFLDLMALMAVTLGGLGMQSTLTAWLRSRQTTVAVVRTLGASERFVVSHYSAIALLAALLGYFLGLAGAGYLLNVSGEYLTAMLPVEVTPGLSLASALQSALLCLLVTAAFAAWPLYEASQVRPARVLRAETFEAPRRTRLWFGTGVSATLFALLSVMVQKPSKAAWLLGSVALVGLVSWSISRFLVQRLKNFRPHWLVLRTALGSWRAPEARTELVLFILSTCLAVLYTAVICQEALMQSWVDAMPEDSPNLIFLDIQEDQATEFTAMVGADVELFANMRVRIQDINGKPLDRSGKREYWQRDGRGKLDALPTRDLPPNDTLLQGETLYQGTAEDQVSVRDDIAEALDIKLGDRLTVGIQGVPVTATVSSIRKSSREGFKPRFELLFPPSLVEGAPRNMFATARVPETEVGALQTKLARAFPNVVSMDLSLTIRLIAERLLQMTGLVQYFLASGLAAGVLILVSATWSARQRRARESAYFKVMGAGNRFLGQVVLTENLLLGFTTSGLGLGLAMVASWAICYWSLKVDFPSLGAGPLWMLLIPAILIACLGWLVTRGVIATRPAPYLKEE